MRREILEKTIKRYDEFAEEYHKKYGYMPESEKPYLTKFFELMSKDSPRVLDTGCGTGRDLKFLENFEIESYGIDLSRGMLSIAKRNLKKTNLVRGNYLRLPFKDNTFDGIINIASLVHIPHQDKFLALNEFKRVLKPKGILYISIQNLLYPERFEKVLKYSTKEGVYFDGRYWYFPTLYEMRNLIEDAKFEIIDFEKNLFSNRLKFYARA